MIKYRSTACPELIFIHDLLLRMACQELLCSRLGRFIMSMSSAIKRKKSGRKRRRASDVVDELLLGKGKTLSSTEEDAVLPDHEDIEGLTGLPYLLYSDTSLHALGWPAFPRLREGIGRLSAVLHELGLPSLGIPGDPGVRVTLHKFVRAILPVGDTVSSLQCTTQRVKDNRWCHVQYDTHDGGSEDYIGLFQYFVLAQYHAPTRTDHLGGRRLPPQALRLAVVHLHACEAVAPPGGRDPDPVLGRKAEMYRVVDEPLPGGGVGLPFRGEWVLPLEMLQSQVVPTKKLGNGMYFMWANKASGRTSSVIVG